MKSGLYTGVVYHRRSRPRVHALRYRVFSLLIDLDEIADMTQRLRLLRFNRGGLFSFHEQDHGDGSGTLRTWVEDRLRASGAALPGGRIEVLAYPRVLGYVFNPLSVFFCYRADGQLAVILYEVSNTYREKHTYVVPVDGTAGPVIRQEAAKAFHVSPFLPLEGRYSFLIEPPGPHVAIGVNLHDDEGILLATSFKGERKPLTDRTLAAAFLKFPLMTLKVIAGIHWEALRLWRKGIAFRPHGKAAAAIGTSVAPGLPPERGPAPSTRAQPR